jgi:hypothetical protein
VRTARQEGIRTLYHYQGSSLDHLRDTLQNGRVRFSNPNNFNDPWDCRPYFDSESLADPAVRKQWGDFFEPMIPQLPAESQAIFKGLGANWFDHPQILSLGIRKMSPTAWQRIAEIWRIYCLTPHPGSLLMWAHYADKHRGLCLEFDAGREFGASFQVVYRDEMLAIGPNVLAGDDKALADAVMLTKSSEWGYENEYRMLARDGGADPAFSMTTDGDYLRLPAGSLTAVVAGASANVAGLRDLLREYAPGVRLKMAIRRAHRYHLDIVDDAGGPV